MLIDHIALLRREQPESNTHLSGQDGFSDMDIIHYQSLLMSAGGITFKAIYSGEMPSIMTALVHTAYVGLEAAINSHQEISEHRPVIGQSYQLLDIVQHLSHRIHACSSGDALSYLDLYHSCSALTTDFLNADFSKAFGDFHRWRMASSGQTILDYQHLPDLTHCLYE